MDYYEACCIETMEYGYNATVKLSEEKFIEILAI